MEIRKGISDPARDERVLAVSPPLVPDGHTTWHRRLNLYTGRSLSADALETEQNDRAGRMTAQGQLRSPGVVSGLEIELERGPDGDLAGAWLHVGAGYGIADSGEDVALPAALRIPLGQLPVAGFTLEGIATLARLRDEGLLGDTLPVAVLVLRPALLATVGDLESRDPCDNDESDDAFEDIQLADAALVELFPWPLSLALPPRPAGVIPADSTPAQQEAARDATLRWRNALAYAAFEADAALAPPALLPWAGRGVPIGLVGFGPDWQPLFVDRASVARAGGKPARRSSLQPERGSPFLWQARMEQLAEQLTDPQMLALDAPTAGRLFRRLPPAGIIPRDAVDLAGAAARNRFFPPSFGVDAVPIPLEQLDLALEASAALDPFDTQTTDYVRVLVPVPGQLYEPRLLLDETIDPLFQETISAFLKRCGELRERRRRLRDVVQRYAKALENRDLEYKDDALPGEDWSGDELDPPEQSYGIEIQNGAVVIVRYIKARQIIEGLPGGFIIRGPDDTFANPDLLGLSAYVQRLRDLIDAADDQIDVCFLRVQTDIYRVRQLVLGNDIGSKLVTSSALAAIVKEETSSYTTREALGTYVRAAKGRAVSRDTSGTLAEPTPGATALGGEAGPTSALSFAPQNLDVSALSTPPTGVSAVNFGAVFATPVFLNKGTFSVLRPKSRLPDPIIYQQPIPGTPPVFRDTTLGQRLQQGTSDIARDNTRATYIEIINALCSYSLFASLEVPIVTKYERGRVIYDRRKIEELQKDPNEIYRVEMPGEDEVATFNVGIDMIDVAVAALRAAEGRIRSVREQLRLIEQALEEILLTAAAAEQRLAAIDNDLAEGRHDVAVAQALMAEEQQRIDAINTRRERILAEAVEFLAYVRPRTTDTLRAVPGRLLDPAATGSAVPACLRNPQTVPAELRAFVDLFRDVPIRWLVQMPALLDRLDRIELLHDLILTGVGRAAGPGRSRAALFQQSSFTGRPGQAVARTYTAQQQVTVAYRAALARFDPRALQGRTWRQLRDVAAETSSLDDLVAAGHGNSEVARRALQELDDMGRVAACLHADFAAVPPVVRLQWAEILSEYDDPIDLRNLARLPAWSSIPIVQRRAMQQLVDWLHGAIEGALPQAVAMVNDLVRICILLASHAPVGQLISARVAQATPVQPGGRLTLALDQARVKVGMQVLLYDRNDQSRLVAHAVVDDLHERGATARVIATADPSVQIEVESRVVVTASAELQQLAALGVRG
ncbi:MAG TPA: hypothetical protein VFS21_22100 [Roseiflexaceae bacterium]|nr:hypothetical protein [Roseiflexaceae bacterium]